MGMSIGTIIVGALFLVAVVWYFSPNTIDNFKNKLIHNDNSNRVNTYQQSVSQPIQQEPEKVDNVLGQIGTKCIQDSECVTGFPDKCPSTSVCFCNLATGNCELKPDLGSL